VKWIAESLTSGCFSIDWSLGQSCQCFHEVVWN
jgi:hypothetical protein